MFFTPSLPRCPLPHPSLSRTARIINCDRLNPTASLPLSSPRSRWQPASLPSISSLLYIFFPPRHQPLYLLSRVLTEQRVSFSVPAACPSPPLQDTQSTSAQPDDSGSVLMDETSSQWSAAADSEEERKSALEKSMYVYVCGCMDLNYSWTTLVTWMCCHLFPFIRQL